METRMITYCSVHTQDETKIDVRPGVQSKGYLLYFGDAYDACIFLTPLSAKRLVERLQEALDSSSRAVQQSPERIEMNTKYDCEDCGQSWDYDFRPDDEALEEFGLELCAKCAERRFEAEYLNSVESRADRAYGDRR